MPALADEPIPTKPEAGTFKLGLEPWLGYGQWQIAAAEGIFAKNGLEKVELVNFTEDKDINAALASGQIDGANIATHTAMAMAAAGLPIKIVMLEDISMSADAIIAGKDINSIADLKGKQVAFEQGTTSDILLNYALQANGMTIADVQIVPMPAADAGSALIAERVPVAVTYEPYLTIARKQDPDVKLLYTAGEDPGLVSDVLVVRDEVLKSKPGQVLALVKSWDQAVQYYKAHTSEGRDDHRQIRRLDVWPISRPPSTACATIPWRRTSRRSRATSRPRPSPTCSRRRRRPASSPRMSPRPS